MDGEGTKLGGVETGAALVVSGVPERRKVDLRGLDPVAMSRRSMDFRTEDL